MEEPAPALDEVVLDEEVEDGEGLFWGFVGWPLAEVVACWGRAAEAGTAAGEGWPFLGAMVMSLVGRLLGGSVGLL